MSGDLDKAVSVEQVVALETVDWDVSLKSFFLTSLKVFGDRFSLAAVTFLLLLSCEVMSLFRLPFLFQNYFLGLFVVYQGFRRRISGRGASRGDFLE